MKKFKTLLILSLAGLLTFTAPAVTANAAWKNTSAGKIYTQKASPGYVTGMKKIGSYWYYFNSKGIMQKGIFQKVGKYTYYFRKKDGRRYQKGWLTSKKQKYYFTKDGIMLTGLQKIGKNYYYFSNKGVMQKGWVRTSQGNYYADKKTGILAISKWVGNYYFLANGKMAVNTWVDGKYVGADGKFNGVTKKIGWVTSNGRTYYYDSKGRMVKGWLSLKGKSYYLHPSTGVLQKGWITVGGNKYYGGPKAGVILKSQWVDGKYLKKSGVMATGLTTIGKKTYLFDSNGKKKTGWQTHNKKTYYFDSKGVMQKNAWIDKRYVNSNGVMATGFATINKKTYYLHPSTGKKQTGFVTVNGSKYYLSVKNGELLKSRWILSKAYYCSSSGAILKGLHAISQSIYYFDPASGKKLTSSMKTIGSDTYYFQSTGAAAKNTWVKIGSKYYYFQSTGKLAKNTWVGKYYVDANGVRTGQTKKTGWQTVNGQTYYYDNNGYATTGLATISGSTYYFNSSGVMQTGIQSVGSKKYYFYADGKMAVSTTLIVGAKQYTINSSGVVTSETSIKVTNNTKGAQIVNFALQYVGNPYVYGGVSLTNGADCSGFVQTVFSHFGYKLLRVANDQMYGPTTSYINNYGYTKAVVVDLNSIQAGDLLFYGSGNYASHVTIYMGNGQMVHASNSQPYPKGGIKVSDYYNYGQTPLKAVRYWS